MQPREYNETLTKPEFGALDFRKANPDKINYIRVVTTDDIQGPAMAITTTRRSASRTCSSSTT